MAILNISIVQSDTRWAKEIRLFGIPIFHQKELDVTTKKERDKIGFPIGTVPRSEYEEDDEEIDTQITCKHGIQKPLLQNPKG